MGGEYSLDQLQIFSDQREDTPARCHFSDKTPLKGGEGRVVAPLGDERGYIRGGGKSFQPPLSGLESAPVASLLCVLISDRHRVRALHALQTRQGAQSLLAYGALQLALSLHREAQPCRRVGVWQRLDPRLKCLGRVVEKMKTADYIQINILCQYHSVYIAQKGTCRVKASGRVTRGFPSTSRARHAPAE